MGEISKAKPGGEVDAADDWLADGGSTVKNPSAGPSGETAGAQGGDDWILDTHAGAGGSSDDQANQKQGGPTGDGEVRNPALPTLPTFHLFLRCIPDLPSPPFSTR